jgi:radical SAM protein
MPPPGDAPAGARPEHPLTTGHGVRRDFARTPLNVYWEMTQGCALACRHCRAEAMQVAPPGELSRDEGFGLLRALTGFGNPLPHLILTGGDPLQREDLEDLVAEAARLGIGTSITPAATPRLTRDVLARLKRCGLLGLGLSLDAPDAPRHDAIRGVEGTFAITVEAARWGGELGLPLQVNTLVAGETAGDLPLVFDLLKALPVARWSLFFLIAVGRGKVLKPVDAARAEALMGWIDEVAGRAPFVVGTTEAPWIRRVARERRRHDAHAGPPAAAMPSRSGAAARGGLPVRDGHGVMFVSSTGSIYPSGFLPIPAGHVRADDPVEVYRSSPLFEALHHPERFRGRCGRCEYRRVCGGSRARAFAFTGDPLETDPLCAYEPDVHAALVG